MATLTLSVDRALRCVEAAEAIGHDGFEGRAVVGKEADASEVEPGFDARHQSFGKVHGVGNADGHEVGFGT